MICVPPDTKWYLAELTEEVSVEGDLRNVVRRHTRFIYAHSPEEAYEKALCADREVETPQEEPGHKLVHTRFWGLSGLNLISDDHGY